MIKKIKDIIRRWTGPADKPEPQQLRAAANRQVGIGGFGQGAKFPAGMSRSSISSIIHDHFTIRQNARDAMYDSMEGRSLVESQVDTIVDAGLMLKPVPIASMLGITEETAEAWAEETAQAFHLWAQSKKSHRARINNFYQNQRLYGLFQQRDNDMFVRFFYGRDKDQINPLQLEFIDPNQINGQGYTSTYANVFGEDGIIRDSNGRETAYKVWNYDGQTGAYSEQTVPARGEKSGRTMMTHGFNPEYAGQGRGYSRLAHVLQELENLTDYRLATLQKAIDQASIVFATENDIQDSSNPLEGRTTGPREYGVPPEDETSEGEVVLSDEPVVNYTAMPEATLRQPGVGVFNLRRGDKFKSIQETSPSASFDSFCNAVFSNIAASEGTSIEVVLKKFNNNYSASRATLILCWRSAVIWRNEMAADFLDPVYEAWLSEEIAAGRIQAPGFSDPRLRAAWLNCEWAGSMMPNIDPLKSIQADKEAASVCATTLDDIAKNWNGSSGKANRAKNARQFQELPPVPWPQAPIQVSPDNSNDNQNGGQNNA
jgi:lambda family phage portal protein